MHWAVLVKRAWDLCNVRGMESATGQKNPMQSFLAWAACFSILAPALPLRAEEVMATANSEKEQGVAAYQRGDHEGALAHFERAYELSNEAGLLYAMAQAERALGRCAEAKVHYQEFIQKSEHPAEVQAAETNLGRCRETSAREPAPAEGPAAPPSLPATPAPTPRSEEHSAAVPSGPPPPVETPVDAGEAGAPVSSPPPRSWYHDALGGTLVATGTAVAGIGALSFWQSSRDVERLERDAREPSRGSYQSNMDKANAIAQQRRTATVVCIGGGLVAALGVLRYVSLPGPEAIGFELDGEGFRARVGGVF